MIDPKTAAAPIATPGRASSDVFGARLIEALGLPEQCQSITLRLEASKPMQVDVTYFTNTAPGADFELALQHFELVPRGSDAAAGVSAPVSASLAQEAA